MGAIKVIPPNKVEIWDSRKTLLGEGPLSIGKNNELVTWVDILGKSVMSKNFDTGEQTEVTYNEVTSFSIPCKNGGSVVGLASGPIYIDKSGKSYKLPTREEANGIPDEIPTRWNDAKASPQGDLFLGTMTYKADSGRGDLYRLEGDGTSMVKILSGVTISNGLAWSNDGSTLFYIDTPTQGIDAFDFDGKNIFNRHRVWSTSKTFFGNPDGMTIDSAGNLWVAFWEGSCMRRINPNFEVDYEIQLPARLVTSATFAGSDLKTLIITTSQGDLHYSDKSSGAGLTYAVDIDVPGVKTSLCSIDL
jgi:sugar lactone lactonase YvrE